jgi:integrase
MATYSRDRNAWRLTAHATIDGRRKRRTRDFDAPDTRLGRKHAELEESKFREQIEAELDKPATGTFAEEAQAFLARLAENCKDDSVKSRESALRLHVLPYLGRLDFEDDRLAIEVANMHAAWAADGFARTSRYRWHKIVRQIFAEAYRLERIERDPLRVFNRRAPGSPKREHELVVPSAEEIARIEAHAPRAYRDGFVLFVRISARTGARSGSVRNLRWRDVDLDEATLYFGTTKEDKPYTVAIDAGLCDELRDMRRKARETAFSLGLGARLEDLYVFHSNGGTRPLSVSQPTHYFRRAADDAGLSDVHLHCLRHYHASVCLRSRRLSYKEVATRLGCTEANVIENYSHLVDGDADRRAADLMSEIFATG